ncbi:MAG: RluA family pseudouridine synthase [Clostridia bacterium]|nr:RluA family pseudouridine synthase [Clostridia bacterium]
MNKDIIFENEYADDTLCAADSLLRLVSAESDVGKRVDAFISDNSDLTRSAAVRLIESGDIVLEGTDKTLAKNYKLKAGDIFTVTLPEPEPSQALPQNIPLDVIYEDRDIIVINKPEGMVVHPAPGNPDGTLVNALLYHCRGELSGIGGVIRPGIVHRIDKDTGGLLVVAKNDEAHLFLAEEIKYHRVERIYHAIVRGNFKEDSGTVDAPIGRHPVDRKRMAVIRSDEYRSREAVTHWRVLERFGQFTHVECRLETGRTHQIRVHMASLGHSLMGDGVYGASSTPFEARHKSYIHGQCLFASTLILTHPVTKQKMEFSAPLPSNFEKLLTILRAESEK